MFKWEENKRALKALLIVAVIIGGMALSIQYTIKGMFGPPGGYRALQSTTMNWALAKSSPQNYKLDLIGDCNINTVSHYGVKECSQIFNSKTGWGYDCASHDSFALDCISTGGFLDYEYTSLSKITVKQACTDFLLYVDNSLRLQSKEKNSIESCVNSIKSIGYYPVSDPIIQGNLARFHATVNVQLTNKKYNTDAVSTEATNAWRIILGVDTRQHN